MINGVWSQNAKLVSPNPVAFEWFGGSLSVSEHSLAIGAVGASTYGNLGGAVYVYSDKNANTWKYVQTFEGVGNDYFGKSLALHGNVMAIGSPGAYRYKATTYDAYAKRTGRVSVYRLVDNIWQFEEYICCIDCEEGATFGMSVDINYGTVVVGRRQGAYAYQYDNYGISGYLWAKTIELQPPDNLVNEMNGYGVAVAVSTSVIFVGSKDEVKSGGLVTGAVYAFQGTVDGYFSTLQKLLSQEITVYTVLYAAIGGGLMILAILPVFILAHVLYDRIKAEEGKSKKEQKPLIK